MSTRRLLFQWAGAIKIQLSGHHYYIINVTTIQLKLALLTLNKKTHLLTHYTLFVCSWNVQKSTVYWTGLLIYKALLTCCCVSDFGKQLITLYSGIRIYIFFCCFVRTRKQNVNNVKFISHGDHQPHQSWTGYCRPHKTLAERFTIFTTKDR